MSQLEATYPPEPHAPTMPSFTRSEGMTAAMARGGDFQKSPVRGQPQQQEVLDLRTGAGGVTPLMTACQEGHERTVRQILHMKPSMVHERDRNGKTALHYCTDNPTLACIDQVVAADPSLLSAQEEDGHTPLHLATIAGNRVVAKYLLTRGADVNALDDEKHTAIHWATVCGEQQLLEMLMETGGDPSTPDIHGAYPIHYAAQMCGPNGDPTRDMMAGLEILKTLIQYGVPIDVRDRDGREPMLWAASSGSADAIMILKKAGASVMAADKDGLTALHCAASRGHLDCIDMLITLCNCDVDLLDSNGCSPLFYAVTLGHADCTQMLLNNGADADRQDRKGRTPAHCGAAKGQLETLKLLHQHNADLWKRNIKGDLPLHEACQSGRKDLVVWLLSMMTEMVNASNSDGRTPLHIAAINNNTGLCKILMDHNAAVNPIMRNSKGQLLTPVDAAVARGHKGCAQFLQLHSATSAAKLTDKRALQLALSKAMEGGSGDRTGATPTSELGYQDLLIPSSADSRRHDVGTLTAAELKDSATDTQTPSSEVNIRELVVEEPRMAQVAHEARALHARQKQERARMQTHEAMVHQSAQPQESGSNSDLPDSLIDKETAQSNRSDPTAEVIGEPTNSKLPDEVEDRQILQEEMILQQQANESQNKNYEQSSGEENGYTDDNDEEIPDDDMPIKEKPKSIFALSKSDEEKLQAQNRKRKAMVKKRKESKNSNASNEYGTGRAKSLESKPHQNIIEEEAVIHALSAGEIDKLYEIDSYNTQAINTEKSSLQLPRTLREGQTSEDPLSHQTKEELQPTSITPYTADEVPSAILSEDLGTSLALNNKLEPSDTIDMVDSLVLGEKEEYAAKSPEISNETKNSSNLDSSKYTRDDESASKSHSLKESNSVEEKNDTTDVDTNQRSFEPSKEDKDISSSKDSGKSRSSKQSSSKSRSNRRKDVSEASQNEPKPDKLEEEEEPLVSKISSKSQRSSVKSNSDDKDPRTQPAVSLEKEELESHRIEDDGTESLRSSSKSMSSKKSSKSHRKSSKHRSRSESYSQMEDLTEKSGDHKRSKSSHNCREETVGSLSDEGSEMKESDKLLQNESLVEQSSQQKDGENLKSSLGEDTPADSAKAEQKSPKNIVKSDQSRKLSKDVVGEISLKVPKTSTENIDTQNPITTTTDDSSTDVVKDSEKEDNDGKFEVNEASHASNEATDSQDGQDKVVNSETNEDVIDPPNVIDIEINGKVYKKVLKTKSAEAEDAALEVMSSKVTRKALNSNKGKTKVVPQISLQEPVTKPKSSRVKKEKELQPLKTSRKRVKYSNKPSSRVATSDVRTHEMLLTSSELPELNLKDAAPRKKKESGYSGSHREDSEADQLSDDDGGIVTKSAMRRKLHNEKKLTKDKDDRDYRSEDDETGALTDRPRKKKGGRYNEDGDEYDDVDDAYADMEDLPHHLSARRRAQNRGRRRSDGDETGGTSSDSGSQKKAHRSAPTEMSITQAMQTTMRKYTLERRLFQQLLELKRQQIRNRKVNESGLIKRMSDANNRDSTMLGLRGYAGPMNFQSYEKHLYDQLKFLQSSQIETAPQFKPMDDIDKLNRALHRTEISESKQDAGSNSTAEDDVPSDPRQCNRRTHRCHHAAHAYTGIPCAAFLAPRGKKYIERRLNNIESKVTLPKIDGAASQAGSGPATYRGRNSKRVPAKAGKDESSSNTSYMGVQGYDPKKPLTVELQPSTPPTAAKPVSASDEASERGYTPSSAGGRSVRRTTASVTRSASLSGRRNSEASEQDSPAEEKPQSADV
ncbi:Ankyrin repeat-containing domain [Trinorchestia longiramus]|nr:Ankyrin repeat-containing domain [Trinorchestia longiramus]